MTARNPSESPIADAPGVHPVGSVVGAAGGAVAGAAIGAVAGPVGAAVGGALGAVAGSLAGRGAAETVNPAVEDSYWRENYTKTPGYKPGYTYDDYAPAYCAGYTCWERARASGETFDAHEPTVRSEFERIKGKSRLRWEEAKEASRAAWHRVERAIPGDADKDGR